MDINKTKKSKKIRHNNAFTFPLQKKEEVFKRKYV
jgi:hypothetical protein